ncbi:MAG: hypothetical protein HFG76_03545 [Hungatella sp.]|nr:hypothetical protein [Hungatella sp.]MCI9635459.1 hypothetical protein [Hungatella sp.]
MESHQKWKKIAKTLFILIGITVLLECTLFNYRYWESKNYKPIEDIEISLGSGIEWNNEGYYQIVNSSEAYITLSGFKTHINNIYIDIRALEGVCAYIELFADDAANNLGLRLGDMTLVSSVPQSCYTRLHLSGDSTYVRIKLNQEDGYRFFMDTPPGLNIPRPFILSKVRLAIVLGIVLFFYLFRPGSEIYKASMIVDSYWKKAIIIGSVIIHLGVIWLISQLIIPDISLKATLDNWPAHEQYNELADAFMKGQVYLDREPPKSLETVENPYDTGLRDQVVVKEAGESFVWDYAYFNGKYYCYFGPVPVILFFIPARLILGEPCNTWDVVTLCTLLFCIAGFYLIYTIGKEYYKSLSLGLYLLMSSLYVWGSAIIYLVYYGVLYSLPIICGLLFGTAGLACWVSAKKNGKLKKSLLIIGSLLVALVMGCRLQMAIILLLAFPIFWPEIISKQFFSKKGVVNTLCVILPFLFIGVGLLYYNYLRFLSPLDFGANYNLTSNDMTNRGVVFDRIPIGTFIYLFQPLMITIKYPYQQLINVANDYMGYTNSEPLFGGFFAINLVCVLTLFVFRMKRIMKKDGVYSIAVCSFIFAIIIMVVDIQMAGLTQRYMSDFGWLIVLCTILQIFTLEKIFKMHYEKIFREGVLVMVSISLFLNFWTILINGKYADLINTNPTIFYSVKYLLPFSW